MLKRIVLTADNDDVHRLGKLMAATSVEEVLQVMLRFVKVASIKTRAHNLCHDNRQLIVLAINGNHSASKSNCNFFC